MEQMNLAELISAVDARQLLEVGVFIAVEMAGYQALQRLLDRSVPRPITGGGAAA